MNNKTDDSQENTFCCSSHILTPSVLLMTADVCVAAASHSGGLSSHSLHEVQQFDLMRATAVPCTSSFSFLVLYYKHFLSSIILWLPENLLSKIAHCQADNLSDKYYKYLLKFIRWTQINKCVASCLLEVQISNWLLSSSTVRSVFCALKKLSFLYLIL